MSWSSPGRTCASSMAWGATDTTNGLGNLIVGYNELRQDDPTVGSTARFAQTPARARTTSWWGDGTISPASGAWWSASSTRLAVSLPRSAGASMNTASGQSPRSAGGASATRPAATLLGQRREATTRPAAVLGQRGIMQHGQRLRLLGQRGAASTPPAARHPRSAAGYRQHGQRQLRLGQRGAPRTPPAGSKASVSGGASRTQPAATRILGQRRHQPECARRQQLGRWEFVRT